MDKKIPVRQCIGCREKKPKNELVRIVKDKEQNIFLDRTGKANGRGAYICDSAECFSIVAKKKMLNKTFSMNVSDDIYAELKEEFMHD